MSALFCVNDFISNFNEIQIELSIQRATSNSGKITGFIDNILILSNAPTSTINETQLPTTILFPNPSNTSTTIITELDKAGIVKITLDDYLGNELLEIDNNFYNEGQYIKEFSIETLPSGVFYVKISHNGRIRIEKIVKN